jgi:hypothetical protein
MYTTQYTSQMEDGGNLLGRKISLYSPEKVKFGNQLSIITQPHPQQVRPGYFISLFSVLTPADSKAI